METVLFILTPPRSPRAPGGSIVAAVATAVLLTLPAAVNADPLARAEMAGHAVVLGAEQGQCVIERAGQTMRLDIPSPCAFSPDRAGQARVERFRDLPIVLVVNVQPDPERQGECLTTARAVRLKQGRLEASTPLKHAGCVNGGTDQKVFVGLFAW